MAAGTAQLDAAVTLCLSQSGCAVGDRAAGNKDRKDSQENLALLKLKQFRLYQFNPAPLVESRNVAFVPVLSASATKMPLCVADAILGEEPSSHGDTKPGGPLVPQRMFALEQKRAELFTESEILESCSLLCLQGSLAASPLSHFFVRVPSAQRHLC